MAKKKVNNDYKVICPDGKIISVDEYMETDDHNNRLENGINSFLTNEKEQELIDLFKKK